MEDMELKLCNKELEVADITVKGMNIYVQLLLSLGWHQSSPAACSSSCRHTFEVTLVKPTQMHYAVSDVVLLQEAHA